MAKWGTKNPPQKKGRYLVTIETSFGRQVRQADRCEYPKLNDVDEDGLKRIYDMMN